MFMFGTDDDIRWLSQCKTVLSDGTFHVPKLFAQLYVFHGMADGIPTPLVYVLLARKNEKCYSTCRSSDRKIAIADGMLFIAKPFKQMHTVHGVDCRQWAMLTTCIHLRGQEKDFKKANQ